MPKICFTMYNHLKACRNHLECTHEARRGTSSWKKLQIPNWRVSSEPIINNTNTYCSRPGLVCGGLYRRVKLPQTTYVIQRLFSTKYPRLQLAQSSADCRWLTSTQLAHITFLVALYSSYLYESAHTVLSTYIRAQSTQTCRYTWQTKHSVILPEPLLHENASHRLFTNWYPALQLEPVYDEVCFGGLSSADASTV